MKNKLITTLAALLILSFAAILFIWQLYKNKSEESKRNYSNVVNLVREKDEAYTHIELQNKQIKELYPEIAKLRDSLKIQKSKLEKVYVYETIYKHDTIPFYKPTPVDTNLQKIILKGENICFSSIGLLDLTKTGLKPTHKDIENIGFMLLGTEVKNKGKIFYFKQRDKKSFLFFTIKMWPFCKLRDFSQDVNECEGKGKIQEIDIIRK